jgi:hypothetical protein
VPPAVLSIADKVIEQTFRGESGEAPSFFDFGPP